MTALSPALPEKDTVPFSAAPRGMRLHIGIFGRRNVGKSSLLNAITRQSVSIVSEHAGTTTDPVEKTMEFLPLGPVVFIDTAGIDDDGDVGTLRVAGTQKVFDRTELALLVTDGAWGTYEDSILAALRARQTPAIVVVNKTDLGDPSAETRTRLESLDLPLVWFSAVQGRGILELRQAMIEACPADFLANPVIVGDLVGAGELAVLVIPVDKEAPRGRLILPQAQIIRDLLDAQAMSLVVQEDELAPALARLKTPPKIVITDSQAFPRVSADTPPDILMTGFSVLFSRFKGDLITQTLGAMAVDTLRPHDKILIAEACSYHPIEDDIGREKIPRWLKEYVGGDLDFTIVQGKDYPEDLTPYKLVIHCGACTFNRKAMLQRILNAKAQGVPITNYGLVIAYSLGLFERALQPFPEAHAAWRGAQRGTTSRT